MPYLLIFLRCSLAFAILPVSILLQCAPKSLKLLKANCVFVYVILLFLLPQLVSIRNEDLQTLTVLTLTSGPDTLVITPPGGTT